MLILRAIIECMDTELILPSNSGHRRRAAFVDVQGDDEAWRLSDGGEKERIMHHSGQRQAGRGLRRGRQSNDAGRSKTHRMARLRDHKASSGSDDIS